MKPDKAQETVAQHVRDFGWHCLHVHPNDESSTPFSYSIGFFKTFRSPEILIFNVEREKAHALLSECAEVLRSGAAFEANQPDDRILAGGYKVIFRPLRPDLYGEYVGTAMRYYEHGPFPAWVMFYPDAAGRFPWEPGYDYIPADEAMSVV